MKIGKLDVSVVEDKTHGQVFKIRTTNRLDGNKLRVLFETKQLGNDSEQVTLSISRNTAILLADFIDRNIDMSLEEMLSVIQKDVGNE